MFGACVCHSSCAAVGDVRPSDIKGVEHDTYVWGLLNCSRYDVPGTLPGVDMSRETETLVCNVNVLFGGEPGQSLDIFHNCIVAGVRSSPFNRCRDADHPSSELLST